MTAAGYANIYRIPKELIPLMEKLNPAYWYLFASKKVIDVGEKNIIICTGYYSGTGPNSKRVDVTPIVLRACTEAGYLFNAYNDAKRGGVKGQKVKIYYKDKVTEPIKQEVVYAQ